MAQRLVFDWVNKIIALNSGEIDINVMVDLYSDAKEDWRTDPELNKFAFPFRTVGGDPTVGVQTVEPYFFLQGGWQIRPSEADQNLTLLGNLFVEGGGNPLVPTLGDFTVLANQLTTITRVSTEVSGEIEASLSSGESAQLFSLPDLVEIEGSTVIAKESTVQYISGEIESLPTLVNMESSTILAKQAELLRAVGLMQENYYLDQTVYTTYNGAKLLTSGRLRTYIDAVSVGTSSNVLATYTISAVWSNDELSSYGVVKQ
jgi:hypothetical protein